MESLDARDRFLSRVEKTEGCWLWTGASTARQNGRYGQLRWDGRTRNAHKVSYELFVGPVPEGLELDHLCRVTLCVRPDHLEPVTHRENMWRSPRPNYVAWRNGTCIKGHPRRGKDHFCAECWVGTEKLEARRLQRKAYQLAYMRRYRARKRLEAA